MSYINREALLDEYDRQHKGPPGLARELIVNAPAADVREVRRGRWKPIKPYNDTCMGFECSECGAQFQGIHMDNYCGNCGAKMED